MNHASPEALTMLARNPGVDIPELDTVAEQKDMTSSGCMLGKLKRAPQKRTTHDYQRGEVAFTDVMGAVKIEGIPETYERYFILFIAVKRRYVYIQPINKRAETPDVSYQFLKKWRRRSINNQFG